MTVNPANDAPEVDVSGVVTTTLAEDTSLNVGPIVVKDLDAADDPLWRGQVTLAVNHGTLTLPSAMTSAQLPLSGQLAFSASGTDADGSGSVAPEAGAFGHGRDRRQRADVGRGQRQIDPRQRRDCGRDRLECGPRDGWPLIDLGASYTVDVLQLWNFNVAGLESYGTSSFDLWVGDSPATMTRVLDNETLARAVAGDTDYLGQTFRFRRGDRSGGPDGTGRRKRRGDGPLTTWLEGRYLFLGDLQGTVGGGHVGLSGLRLYGRAAAAPDLVFVTGNGDSDATLTIQGSLADLNAALASVTYAPNKGLQLGQPGSRCRPTWCRTC